MQGIKEQNRILNEIVINNDFNEKLNDKDKSLTKVKSYKKIKVVTLPKIDNKSNY